MFRLRTFRGLTLEVDGAPYTGPATQRRRLALLVLLADAESGMSRDRLVELLWPDTDPARARHSLDTALSALRREFRNEALFIGVATLHVNPDVLSSDLADYAAALRARDPQRLVDLYTGPFLEGFTLPGAADFERWMEAERGRRAVAHARALGRFASAAASRGDAADAVRWGEARFAVDPLDTSATMDLLTMLANIGRQTEALRIARAHEALIAEELDTSPGSEWLAAVNSLLAQLAEPTSHLGAPGDVPAVAARHSVEQVIPDAPMIRVAADRAVELETPSAPPPPARSEVVARSGVAAGVLLLLAAGALGVLQLRLVARRHAKSAAVVPARTGVSIAVLPFVNTSGDVGDEPFSDGLTDELISALGRVPGLRVTGRTSAFALKGRKLAVRSIADTLGVGAVLEGSVRRARDRLRITAQLVSASDNAVLWTATYDRRTTDVFAVQEEIARQIVTALPSTVVARTVPIVALQTRDLETYELYLRGRYFLGRRTPTDLRRAATYFEQAVARDSLYAQAYAGLADARVLLVLVGDSPPHEELPRARLAAARAIRLDSTLSEAYAASSNIIEGFDWDSAGSERASMQAIALDPGNVAAHLFRGIHLLNRGRLDDAVSELTVARTLDPLSAPVRMQLGRAYITARRSDDAVASLRIAVELNPELAAAYLSLGDALLQQRRTTDAVAAFRRAAALNGGRDSAQLAYGLAVTGERGAAEAILAALLAPSRHKYVPPVPVARAFAGLGDKKSALHWLERAVAERAAQARGINTMPAFDFLHDDPRWALLLRRLRLPA